MAGLFNADTQLEDLLERQRQQNVAQQEQFGQLFGQAAGNRRQAAVNTIGAQIGASFGQGLAGGLLGESDEVKKARELVEAQKGLFNVPTTRTVQTTTPQGGIRNTQQPLSKPEQLRAQSNKFLDYATEFGDAEAFKLGMTFLQQAEELGKATAAQSLDVERRSTLSERAKQANKPILAELVKSPDFSLGDFQKAFAKKEDKPKLERYAVVRKGPDGTDEPVDYINVNPSEPLPELPSGLQLRTITGGRQSPLVNVDTGDKGLQLTPLQEKLDEKFADTIIEWRGGQGAQSSANLQRIKPVIKALRDGEPLTGLLKGSAPNWVLAITNPEALGAREDVAAVVQQSLRPLLGAQFTAQEGENVIARAYNPKLPPEENLKRLEIFVNSLELINEQTGAMVDYALDNGTLKGYKGAMLDPVKYMNSQLDMVDGGAASPKKVGGFTIESVE